MPTRRLRRRLLDHVHQNLRVIGEVGLAGVVTAVVFACGGTQLGPSGTGTDDGGSDGPTNPCEQDPNRCVTEAAQIEGGSFQDATGSGDEGIVVEAAQEAGFDSGEAGIFDATADTPIVVEAAMEAGNPDAPD
jgi:hypothetical protein